jgi:hypothetical protein
MGCPEAGACAAKWHMHGAVQREHTVHWMPAVALGSSDNIHKKHGIKHARSPSLKAAQLLM